MYLLVVVDYFTKWIEVESLVYITANHVRNYFWRNIITIFGIPNTIITDNGLQFMDKKLNDLMIDLNIMHQLTLVEHP